MNTRRFVGGVPVLERHSFSRDEDRALDALERKQLGEANVTPKPSSVAPAPAARMGPSNPPFSFTAPPPEATPAEPVPKVRKPRAAKVAPTPAPAPQPAAVTAPVEPSPPVAAAKPSPADYAAARAAFGVPEVDPDEITDTADLRAFLIRQMKLAAAGKVSPNTAHQVCMFAEKIMAATALEIEAEKVLNLCRRNTLRTVDFVGTL